MTGFDLPSNFHSNPERIERIVRRRVVPPQKKLTWLISSPSTSASASMAQKTLRQFSAPSSSHIPIGLNANQAGNDSFELKTGLVNMVQASNTINPKGTTLDDVCLRLFPFSLLGKAKTWFYSNKEAFTTWEAGSNAFLAKNALRNRITRIQQLPDETIPEVWERL